MSAGVPRPAVRSNRGFRARLLWCGLAVLLLGAGCRTLQPPAAESRRGDEIIVAGRYFHTGTRVITWRDEGGYNAYAPLPSRANGPAPDNHGTRHVPVALADSIPAAGPMNLAGLRRIVDQFVLHYDDEGFSKRCFAVLQHRGLSVHFLLDVDGTVYQTLDLRDRAYHATIANSRSIGIEIANPGAYPPAAAAKLGAWYRPDATGRLRLTIPPALGDPGIHTPNFVARPARPGLQHGTINGQALVQYDFTPQQYAALIKLTAELHRIFPRIRLDYPRDARGRLVMHRLSTGEWQKFHGILGHWHIQANKVDPGPAFDWEKLITGARRNQ